MLPKMTEHVTSAARLSTTPVFEAYQISGQKQTLHRSNVMSALPPKADIRRVRCDVRFVPKDGVIGRRSC
jgi:hypothetical protein